MNERRPSRARDVLPVTQEHLVTNTKLRRLDATRVAIENPFAVPVTLFAREDVLVEDDAIEQLLGFVALEGTLRELEVAERAGRIAPFWGGGAGRLERVVVTPDFHKGGGIPVGTVADARGFVVPQAVGNDVCCGMRLLVTDLRRGELESFVDRLAQPLRHVFFLGGRDIPLSPRQREALLREGLWGLHDTSDDNAGVGLWRYYDARAEEEALTRVHFQGVLEARELFAFADWVRSGGARDGRDTQIGSVGGGNHFVELQVVEDVLDGPTASEWGIERDAVAIMVHSGSVSLGHAVGGFFVERARELYPRELQRPAHGFYALPTEGPHAQLGARYLDAMRNAANFAFGNRLFLGLMALRVLSEARGRRVESRLVYDAPHNLVWGEPGAPRFLHRKGACPALGPEPTMAGPFRYTGHPVIIPGSMGASSFVLAGAGHDAALASACHGAGRSISRGKATRVDDATFTQAVARLRVVTPVDLQAPETRLRRDIVSRYQDRLKEEAPYAYKDITPIINTVTDANIARAVARLWPLMTIKG
jgi:tRNA-splicing ligase RtcB